MTRPPIRTLIVDDEPLARSRVRRFLAGEEGIEIVGECAAGREAVRSIEELRPGLVFLDIQMPELDGFGVIEAVGAARMPPVVFLTAYDQYALRAFDVHALDYLLKPYTRERFRRALERARGALSRGARAEADGRLVSLIESLGREQKYLEWLMIKSPGRVFFLRVEELVWVEAEGNYLRLHAGGETHLLRETLSALASKLDPRKFLRIHRSTLAHVKAIKEFRPTASGDYEVILRDDTRLTLSRSYRDKVLDSFQS